MTSVCLGVSYFKATFIWLWYRWWKSICSGFELQTVAKSEALMPHNHNQYWIWFYLLSSWGWMQNLSLLFWMSCRVNGKFRSPCTQLGFALWWQKWVYRVRAGEWRIIESNILVQLQLLTTLTSKPGPQPPARPAGWSWMQICRVLPSAQIISSIFIIIYIEHLQEIYIYIMYSILYIYIILGHGTWYIHRYFWQGSK